MTQNTQIEVKGAATAPMADHIARFLSQLKDGWHVGMKGPNRAHSHYGEGFAAALFAYLDREAAVPSEEPVATVRVTHKGYGMTLSTYVAYALPEGMHDLYVASPAVAPVASVKEALRCLEELANMPLGISLEDWCRLSGPILAALSSIIPATKGGEAASATEVDPHTAAFFGEDPAWDVAKALRNVQKLISEGAATGFNYADGDWAERLYASQQQTSRALAALAQDTDGVAKP